MEVKCPLCASAVAVPPLAMNGLGYLADIYDLGITWTHCPGCGEPLSFENLTSPFHRRLLPCVN
jgi:hypothetical protein